MHDMAYAMLDGYQKMLDAVCKPEIGDDVFETSSTRVSPPSWPGTRKTKDI